MTESFGADRRLPAPDDPIFLDSRGRRRMWLRLTAGVTAGGGVMALAACGLLFTEGPSTTPPAFALPVLDESPGLLGDALAVQSAPSRDTESGGREEGRPVEETVALEPRAVRDEAATGPTQSQNSAPMALASPLGEFDSGTDADAPETPSWEPGQGEDWDEDEDVSDGEYGEDTEYAEGSGHGSRGEDGVPGDSGDDDYEHGGYEHGDYDYEDDSYGGGDYDHGDDGYGDGFGTAVSDEYPGDEAGGEEPQHDGIESSEYPVADDEDEPDGFDEYSPVEASENADEAEPADSAAATHSTEPHSTTEVVKPEKDPELTGPTDDSEPAEPEQKHGDWSVYSFSADEWFDVVDDDRWTALPHAFES